MNYNAIRRPTPEVKIGKVTIGGQNPIAIQSMTNTDTHDAAATIAQIKALASAGCDIVRITVPDEEAAKTILAIKEEGITTPIVADIHFDYKVALTCAAYGVDKIRINPGNIGDDSRVKAVVDACKAKNIPIRIGVNSGSLEKHILQKYGAPTPRGPLRERLVPRLTSGEVRLREHCHFHQGLHGARHDQGQPPAGAVLSLPPPSRRDRGGRRGDGPGQVRRRHRRPALRRHRRHLPGIFKMSV